MTKTAETGNIGKFEVYSNYGDPIDLSHGTVQLQYFESILDNTVRASMMVVETGGGDNPASSMDSDGANLTGGEKVHLNISDNYENTLKFEDDNQFRVKSIRNVTEEANKVQYTLDLWSKECQDNELVENRVSKRYDGLLSDSVKKIVSDVLKSPKEVTVDDTQNTLSFLGRVAKPFYKCHWLAKRSVPQGVKSAGYFFYETSDGYQFRSIDKLFEEDVKKKFVYTNSTLLPDEYDAKILASSFSSNVDVEQSLVTGSIFKTTLRATNLYDNKPRDNEADSKDQQNEETMGGKEFPKIASDVDLQSKSSRLVVKYDKKGVLPPGKDLEDQLKNAREDDYDIDSIIRQSFMRYNQLFTTKLSITIAGDFSLRAGDIVHCDFPEVSEKSTSLVSQKKSGLYMIVDMCHLITTNKSFTKLNLVRESIGRKPF